MAAIKIIALADMLGKQAHLPYGAAALTFQPGGRQAGFLGADLGDGRAARVNLLGDGIKERCARLACGGGISLERAFGGFDGALYQLRSADREVMRRSRRGRRFERGIACDPCACDQVFSVRFKAHMSSP